MDHSITGTSVRAAGWLGSATLPAEIDGWKTPRCRVSASHPGAGPEHTVRFCRRPFSPQFFSPPLSVYLFHSLFLPWEHRRWSVITHHSTEEGFIMGLACWQDYCLDDKCSWLRAFRGKLVAFFFLFPSTKTCPRCSRQRRSGANQEQLTQAVGEAAHLKQSGNSWKISKSPQTSIRADEVITNTAVEFQGQVWGWSWGGWVLKVRSQGLKSDGTNKWKNRILGYWSDKADQSD